MLPSPAKLRDVAGHLDDADRAAAGTPQPAVHAFEQHRGFAALGPQHRGNRLAWPRQPRAGRALGRRTARRSRCRRRRDGAEVVAALGLAGHGPDRSGAPDGDWPAHWPEPGHQHRAVAGTEYRS